METVIAVGNAHTGNAHTIGLKLDGTVLLWVMMNMANAM